MTDKHRDEETTPAEEPAPETTGVGREDPFDVPDDASALVDGATGGAAPAEATAAERGQAAGTPRRAPDELEQLVAERTADLQRLQAEYVNYKRRVDRDRDLARVRGVEQVVNDLLPVLDAIDAAHQHEAVDGGFKLVVEALEKVTAKYGLVSYGEVGDEFDPTIHEALMHVPFEGEHATTVVSAVMQKGIRLGDRVVRPARVGVADPS